MQRSVPIGIALIGTLFCSDFHGIILTPVISGYRGYFASVVIGSLLQGESLPAALDRAVQFISQCIKASYGFNYPKRNGVLLERELNILNMPVLISGYEML